MREIFNSHRIFWKNKELALSALSAFLFLAVSLVINFYAGIYATEKAGASVTDLVLNNVPVFDIDGLFIYGTILFWIFTFFICLLRPQRIPFTFESLGLFTLIRSFFVSLTHIGPFPDQLVIKSYLINKFSFGADQFFSGHTGLPFLLALIFWDNLRLRIFFIASAIFFGIVVLLGHLHYSIDVVSAFFITYTIFHIAKTLFKKDFLLFKTN